MVFDVQLHYRDTTPLVVSPYQGPQAGLNSHIEAFIQWRKAQGLPASRYPTFNLLYGPPGRGGDIKLGLAVGLNAERLLSLRRAIREAGMQEGRLPGVTYACLRLAEYQLPEGIHFLVQHWLPASGHEALDFPLVVERFVGGDGQGIELCLALKD